jgi:hypothetical protein
MNECKPNVFILPDGSNDGWDETVGYDDGIEEGAALCGNASRITKSAAVAAAITITSLTFSWLTLPGGMSPSNVNIATPFTSYDPGETMEGVITWSAT